MLSYLLFFLIVYRVKGVEKAFTSIVVIAIRNVVNFNFWIFPWMYLKLRRTSRCFLFIAKNLFNGLIRFSRENVTVSKITSIKLLKRWKLVWWMVIDALHFLMFHIKFLPVYMKNSLLRLKNFKFKRILNCI